MTYQEKIIFTKGINFMKKKIIVLCCLAFLALLAFFMLPIKAEEPAQNAFIILDWTDGKHSLSNLTIADINGYYEINVAEGTVNVTAMLNKTRGNEIMFVYNSTENFYINGVVWKNITLMYFPMDDATIEGHVYDNSTKQPIAGANVSILFNDDYFGGFNYTSTNADGYYIIHLPSSNVTISAQADGFYTEINATTIASTKIIDFYLDPIPPTPPLTAVVKGYVKNESDNPIVGANISIFGLNVSYYNFTTTDVNGYYEFNVPAGNLSIQVQAKNYFPTYLPPFEVNESETKWVNVSLVHHPPDEAWVDGFVLDNETELPIAGANVTVTGTITIGLGGLVDTYVRNTITDSNGYYNVSVPASYPFLPTPQYSLIEGAVANADGYFVNSTLPPPYPGNMIAPGQTLRLNITLDLIPPENCIVKGYIYIMTPKKIHYVGGAGVGNYTTIQDAIDAASDGDIIKVYPGTYDGPVVINKEIKLMGDPAIDGHGGYGIKIEANNTLVENFTVFNCSYGIRVYNASFTLQNVTIRNCTVYDCANYGIYIYNINDILIENNTVYNASTAGIVIWDANGGDIKNNEVFNSGNALVLKRCSNLKISGNKIHDNDGDGLKITDNSIHNEITSNYIYNNSGYYSGVFIDGSYYNEITSNYIYNNTKYGIYINSRNNTISYNSLYENGFCAVYIAQSNNSVLSNSIYNNSGNGIEIYGSNNVINYNHVYNNDDNGIVIRDTALNVSVTGNKIDNNRLCAIYLIGNNNTVESNTLGINSAYGIYLMGDNNTVSSNNIVSCNYGIYVKETARENEIKDNIIKDSASSDLYIYGQHNTFINNTINSTKFSFTYEGNISIKNASLPALPPSHWQHIGKFLEISRLDANPAWMDIRIYYDDGDIAGLVENTLKIWKYSYGWQEDGWNGSRYLDMANNIVGVNITSFSIFAPLAMIQNHLPYATNPTPANGSVDVSINPTLSVVVYDEDGDTMNVSFYDASSDTLIGYVNGVFSGNTASIIWSGLDYGTTYYWYVIVNDGFDSNKSDVWHFTTTLPKPSMVYVDDDYNSGTPGWGYDHFATITDGINAVASGGTVYVYEGIYEESIVINKELSLIGQGNPANTIIKASGQNAVTIDYPCLIDGFTIRDAHADYDNVRGIWVKADGCIIRNVTVMNITTLQNDSITIYVYGIMINYANNCSLENVTIYDIKGNDSTAYGIYAYESNNNSIKNATIFNVTSVSTAYGIYYSHCINNEIFEANVSNISGSSKYGVYLDYSDNASLKKITVSSSGYGIRIMGSIYSLIEECNISNEFYGIIIDKCNYSIIRNNTVYDNNYGITLWRNCYYNTIENNSIFGNSNYGYGVYLASSSNNNTIASNYIYNNSHGIYLSNSNNNIIKSNDIFNHSYNGIHLSHSMFNNISENYLHDNDDDGIYLDSLSGNNTITSNYIYNNSYYGIMVYSDNNNISFNYIHNNQIGIFINVASNNSIYSNHIYYNLQQGILLSQSENNTIYANYIYNNGRNSIYISTHSSNNKILSNYIYNNSYDGIKLYYYTSNNLIKDNYIYNNGERGIFMLQAKNNVIENNTCHNNKWGIVLQNNAYNNTVVNNTNYGNLYYGILVQTSENNTVKFNKAFNNSYSGITIWNANNNIIYSNSVFDNDEEGILLSESSNNTIYSNHITGNYYGIYLSLSNNNTIYNNYFNNTINAYDEGNNIWNISKKAGRNIVGGAWLGGNYWHDYEGDDINGDDLGDTMLPYNCSGNIKNGGDMLPLVMPANHPPAVPYSPEPANGATGVELAVTLQWQCYDPDGDALTYDVYFGTTANPPKVASNITSASYSTSNLQYSTTYYWRIVAWDENGAKAISPVWQFTTKEDTPPTVTNPHPANGSTGIAINPTLAVDVDDVDGDMLTVTFYDASDSSIIGTKENVSPGSTVSIVWQGLQYSTTYQWYVVVSDGIKSTTSPVWQFTTKAKPQYTLIVSINPANAGTVSMTPAGGIYEEGTVVTLTAVANEGYVFAYWSGDASGTNPTIQITMNSNKNVIANFQLPNTPPEIEILSPSDGSIVSGVVTIQGKAWDVDGNETIQKVEIKIDNGEWKEASGTISWSYSWDTTKVANGLHKIETRCYDGVDYSSIVSINITVNNVANTPPVVSIDYPSNGSTVSGEIIIKGKAWDKDGNESIAKVEIRIDGGEWQNATGILNWAYKLDTKKLKNGMHTIEVRAYDGINYSNIIKINIEVQNKEKKGIPGFELAIIIAAIAVVLIRRKIEKSI